MKTECTRKRCKPSFSPPPWPSPTGVEGTPHRQIFTQTLSATSCKSALKAKGHHPRCKTNISSAKSEGERPWTRNPGLEPRVASAFSSPSGTIAKRRPPPVGSCRECWVWGIERVGGARDVPRAFHGIIRPGIAAPHPHPRPPAPRCRGQQRARTVRGRCFIDDRAPTTCRWTLWVLFETVD